MKRAFWIGSFLVAVALFFVARNVASWRPQLLLKVQGNSPTFQFSSDGRWLLIQNDDLGGNFLWDWEERRLIRKMGYGSTHFSPDGKLLARLQELDVSYNLDNTIFVEILKTQDGSLVKKFVATKTSDDERLADVRWSADGKNLNVVTEFWCRTFDVASGKVLSRWKGHYAEQGAISSDGSQILRLVHRRSQSPSEVCELRETKTGKILRILSAEPGRIGFSADGLFYYTARLGQFKIWRLSDGQLQMTKSTSDESLPHFLKKSNHLAFATSNGLEIRQFPGGTVVEKLSGPRSEPFQIAPDEQSAVSCDSAGKIWRWRLR